MLARTLGVLSISLLKSATRMITTAINPKTQTKIQNIVDGILNGRFQRIITLSGAGISVNSGIPDFRSPGGLYATLRPDLITATERQRRMMKMEPTMVVDFSLFRENQFPYLEVRRPFILGTAETRWKATAAHFFIQLLHEKGLLQRHYTQNIDGLDHQLDLPKDKIINVHGTLHHIQCEFCGSDYPIDEFREEVRTKIRNIYDDSDAEAPTESSNILCKTCNKPGVKPATVMYGRELPSSVWRSISVDFPDNVDLIMVFGTSLTVSPANSLVTRARDGIPRLVMNLEPVGEHLGLDFESPDSKDAILQFDCDTAVLQLVEALGWKDELAVYSSRMCEFSQQFFASSEV